jgi:hypothetical protein
MRSQFRRWRWNLGTEGMAAEDGPWLSLDPPTDDLAAQRIG